MGKYEFNTTNLIAESFEKHGIKYSVEHLEGMEILQTGFSIDCGPGVFVNFFNPNKMNTTDVSMRILRLVSHTPKEKRARILEACNVLNCKCRFIKFCVDADGDVNVEYDLPLSTSERGIGETAGILLAGMQVTLNKYYGVFMKALYTDEALDI